MPSQVEAFALCAGLFLALGVPNVSANEIEIDFVNKISDKSERVIKLPFKSNEVVKVKNSGQDFIYGKYYWINKHDNVVLGSVYVYFSGVLSQKDSKIAENGSVITTARSYKAKPGQFLSDPIVGESLERDILVSKNYSRTYVNSPYSYGETSSYKFILMPLLFYVKDETLSETLEKNLSDHPSLVEKTELSALDYDFIKDKKISGLDNYDKKSSDFDIFSSFSDAESFGDYLVSIIYPANKNPLKDFLDSASKKFDFDGVLPISYNPGSSESALYMDLERDKNIFANVVSRFNDNDEVFEFAFTFFGWLWNFIFFVYTFRKMNTFISGKERRLQ